MIKRICKLIIFICKAFLWGLGVLGFFLAILFCCGIRTYTVLSGSMEPVIHTGGIVLVNTYEKSPEEGEVITYRTGETNVTHRVRRVIENQYETCGDANALPDGELVRQEQILGTVVGTVPFFGYLILHLQSGRGILEFGFFLILYECVRKVSEQIRE